MADKGPDTHRGSHTSRGVNSQFKSLLSSTSNTHQPIVGSAGVNEGLDCACKYFLGRSRRRRDSVPRYVARARTEYCVSVEDSCRASSEPRFRSRCGVHPQCKHSQLAGKFPVCRNCPTGLSRVQPGRELSEAATVPGRVSRGQDTAAGSIAAWGHRQATSQQ